MRLLYMAVDGEIEIAISQPLIDEVRRVLRDKFGPSEEAVREAEAWIHSFTRLVAPKQMLDIIIEDPDDNGILECAAEAGSQYIVSGDKDLHRLGQYGVARVIKVDAWQNVEYAGSATVGKPAPVTSRVAEITGVPARSFHDWAVDHAVEFQQ